MDNLVKIKTSKTGRFGNTITFSVNEEPLDIVFDKVGVAIVSKEIASELLKKDTSLRLLSEDDYKLLERSIEEEKAQLQKEAGSLKGNVVSLRESNDRLREENEALVKQNKELISKNSKLEADVVFWKEKYNSVGNEILPSEEIIEEEPEPVIDDEVDDLEKNETIEENKGSDQDKSKPKVTKYSLQQLELPELRQIAEEAKLPKEQWDNLAKHRMIPYLYDELNARI